MTEPFTPKTRSEKNSRHVVHGTRVEIPPVSRYQPLILSSAAPLPRKAWACGSSRWSYEEQAEAERGKLGPFTLSLLLAAASHP